MYINIHITYLPIYMCVYTYTHTRLKNIKQDLFKLKDSCETFNTVGGIINLSEMDVACKIHLKMKIP